MRDHRIWSRIGVACLAFLVGSDSRSADTAQSTKASKSIQDAKALAARIDRMLAAKWVEAKVTPVGPADDAEYLRRVSIDLIGKIPAASEARDFLDDRSPEKRIELVERLLESPAYTARATELWRQLFLPEGEPEGRSRFAAPEFEAWLRTRVVEDVGYDKIVREILAGRPGSRTANPLASETVRSPTAFTITREGSPENLADGTSRVFLGGRLECAQCHHDPFASWKREDFWGLAAYFAGVSQQGPEYDFGSIREVAYRREPAFPVTEKIHQATFLQGAALNGKAKGEAREALADWVTSPKNPLFARAAANRVWARFFGTAILDPIEGNRGGNPPSHTELLDELANQFVAHDYDLKFLIRALTATRAYGLTSALDRPQPTPSDLFSVMPVRGLSAGQLDSCLAQATGSRERPNAQGRKVVSLATILESSDTLASIAEAPYLDTAGRIEALYLAALTRRPRPDELSIHVSYVEKALTPEARTAALADIFRAILNGPEFGHNH